MFNFLSKLFRKSSKVASTSSFEKDIEEEWDSKSPRPPKDAERKKIESEISKMNSDVKKTNDQEPATEHVAEISATASTHPAKSLKVDSEIITPISDDVEIVFAPEFNKNIHTNEDIPNSKINDTPIPTKQVDNAIGVSTPPESSLKLAMMKSEELELQIKNSLAPVSLSFTEFITKFTKKLDQVDKLEKDEIIHLVAQLKLIAKTLAKSFLYQYLLQIEILLSTQPFKVAQSRFAKYFHSHLFLDPDTAILRNTNKLATELRELSTVPRNVERHPVTDIKFKKLSLVRSKIKHISRENRPIVRNV